MIAGDRVSAMIPDGRGAAMIADHLRRAALVRWHARTADARLVAAACEHRSQVAADFLSSGLDVVHVTWALVRTGDGVLAEIYAEGAAALSGAAHFRAA